MGNGGRGKGSGTGRNGDLRPQTANAALGRHNQIMKVQRELASGLGNFKLADGTGSAAEALKRNFYDARAHFAECVHEAKDVAADEKAARKAEAAAKRAAAGIGGGVSGELRQRPKSAGMGAKWSEGIKLGWLGIPKADIAAAENLRETRAARRLQRVARLWLQRRSDARAAEEAQRRAEAAAAAYRVYLVTHLQAHWRGALGRRAALKARIQRSARHAAASQTSRRLSVRPHHEVQGVHHPLQPKIAHSGRVKPD